MTTWILCLSRGGLEALWHTSRAQVTAPGLLYRWFEFEFAKELD